MDKFEIIERLKSTGDQQELLFSEARQKRFSTYGNSIILRGVIEVTNECRVNCDYCPMRRDNIKINNIFHIDENMILESARKIKEQNIKVVFFQAGETPKTTKLIGNIIPKIRKIFNDDVEILLNLGIKRREEYSYLRDQGATSYILKHETSDPKIHQSIRHEPLSKRINAINDLLDLGYFVGTGMIVGLPNQTVESIADDILLASNLGVHMCSVSPFIPAPNTPLENHKQGSFNIALNAIATMRIKEPHWLIPSVSAMEKISKSGQLQGLHAGANVMTVNFTPYSESNKYLIYGKDRFIVGLEHTKQTIKNAELQIKPSIFQTTKL